MLMQNLAVACIVLACVAYSSWTLMPVAWRRVLAIQLIRSRVLAQSSVLQRAAQPASAGACGGCHSCGSDVAGDTKKPKPTESVIHFVPRKTL
jgi:cytochrome c553